MRGEERAAQWEAIWERRRARCAAQEEVAALLHSLPDEALDVLQATRELASVADPRAHAEADVEAIVDRVDALETRWALLLHGPVCNGLTMLRCAARELLDARAGVPEPPAMRAGAPARPRRPDARRFEWLLVAADGEELVALAEESAGAIPVGAAGTAEAARRWLALRPDRGIVVANLTLESEAGRGPHGLALARDARRRRHGVVLVTAAGDYLGYWPGLAAAGLTGHDVVVKTRRDFADRLRRRMAELDAPEPVAMSYDEDTGHVFRIGDVEVASLEAQEALVLRALDQTWQTPQVVSGACWGTELAPKPSAVPPLISTIARKLESALVEADSPHATAEVIERQRRPGMPVQYRLAPWLGWVEPPEPVGARGSLPPVVVVEDDADWAAWLAGWLGRLGWAVTIAGGVDAARDALLDGEPPIVVADMALADPITGVPHPEVGLSLIEEVAATRHGVRVVVLSAFGGRNALRGRLFDAGVRAVDVIDKASSPDECRAVLLASLQRAADEMWRGVRRLHDRAPAHQLVRLDARRIEVDGVVVRLSSGEARVLEALIRRPNQPVKSELIEYECFAEQGRPHAADDYNPRNKVQSAISQLRGKIDAAAGAGAGRSVVRTPHHGARSAYELHGLVTDRLAAEVAPAPSGD